MSQSLENIIVDTKQVLEKADKRAALIMSLFIVRLLGGNNYGNSTTTIPTTITTHHSNSILYVINFIFTGIPIILPWFFLICLYNCCNMLNSFNQSSNIFIYLSVF